MGVSASLFLLQLLPNSLWLNGCEGARTLPGATKHPRTVVVLPRVTRGWWSSQCPQRMVDLPPSPRVVIHPRCSRATDLPRDCRQSGHWAVAQGVAWGLEVCNEVPTGALGLEKLREGSRAQSWQLTPRVLAPLWLSSVTILSSQKYKDTQNGGCFPGRKGDPRVAVAPGGEEAFPDRPHRWLTGHHVPLCRGALPAFPSASCGHRQSLPG